MTADGFEEVGAVLADCINGLNAMEYNIKTMRRLLVTVRDSINMTDTPLERLINATDGSNDGSDAENASDLPLAVQSVLHGDAADADRPMRDTSGTRE